MGAGVSLSPVSELVAAKLAVSPNEEVTLTVQLPVPLHGPFQPWNVEPDCGVAVNVTGAPGGSAKLQFCNPLVLVHVWPLES